MSKYRPTACHSDNLLRGSRVFGVAILVLLTVVGAMPLTISGAAAAATPTSLAPHGISISTIPQNLPADNDTYPAVVVSIVDRNQQPTAALTDLRILLTSSQETVGKVTNAVVIAKGQTYAIANFTTTDNAGSTVLTAVTTGLTSTSITITTVVAIGYPASLLITAVPGTVPARAANTGKLFVELVDAVGLPAKAYSDTQISIYSSNKNVVNVTEAAVTMKQGEFLQEIDYASGFVPGSAVISASAAGFDSGVTSIKVQGSPPLELKLFAQPSAMVTCNGNVTSCAGRLVVALTDLSGNPTRAAGNIVVQIRSSNLAIINTSETAVIEAGNISATATFSVTSTAGSTTMTTSAPGLQSGFTIITTTAPGIVSPVSCTAVGSPACLLAIYAGPSPVLADHRSYSSVVVSLQTSTGPAINLTGSTQVTLTSSLTGVGNFSRVVFSIPEGQNWAAITFTSTFQIGITQLTASGLNLLPIQTSLGTYGPVPSQVVLTPISSTLPADGAIHPALQLSLEDALGSPAVAPFDVPVNITSTHSNVVKVQPAIIPSGQTFAVVNVTAGIFPGKANITAIESAFSSGYASSSTVLTTIVPAPSVLAVYAPNGGRIFSTNESALPLLSIQLQGASQTPARARAPMNVTITSSNSTVIKDTLTAIIDIGKDFVTIPIVPLVPGTTTLTFTTPGLTTASLAVIFLPSPITESISGGPASIQTGQTAVVSMTVVLDGTGLRDANVQWSVSSGGLTVVTQHTTTST